MTPQWGYQINPQHIYLMKKCSNTWISSDKQYEIRVENWPTPIILHVQNQSCRFGHFILLWLTSKWPLRPIWCVWKHSQWISHTQKNLGIYTKIQVSSMLRTKVTNLAILPFFDWTQMATWTLRPIGCIWTLSQSISHTQNPRDRHQN